MEVKWKWWIVDGICFFLVILSFYHGLGHKQISESNIGSTPVTGSVPKMSTLGQKVAEASNSSETQKLRSSENSLSGVSTEKPVAPVPSSTTIKNKVTFSNKIPSRNKRVATAYRNAPSKYKQELPFTLEELKVCLENSDLRTALYCGRELISDKSTAKSPYGNLALGITLFSSEAFPECIQLMEEAIILNKKTDRNPNCRFMAHKFLAIAYHRIGYKEKAQYYLDEAFRDVPDNKERQKLDMIEDLLDGHL
jgi:tetratricopeptide (TPR) repeat protein